MPDKRILVIDDEPDVLKIVEVRLKAAGYTVLTAANGQEGLTLLSKEIPDLIISDVLMPIMDGYTFYKELKKRKATSDIPVIILTARGQMEDSFKVIGVDEFVAKPFEGEELTSKIKSILDRGPVSRKFDEQNSKKVLVAGVEKAVVDGMALLLKKEGCQTDFSLSGPDIINKVVKFAPDIIVMDAQMDELASHEIIKVLRLLPQFGKKPIVVYVYYNTVDLGSASVREKTLAIDAALTLCKEAGANESIGRYNETIFIKSITPFLNQPSSDKKK